MSVVTVAVHTRPLLANLPGSGWQEIRGKALSELCGMAICFLRTYICGNALAKHVRVGSPFSLAARNREKLREVAWFSASIMTKHTHTQPTISCLSLAIRILGEKKLVFRVCK